MTASGDSTPAIVTNHPDTVCGECGRSIISRFGTEPVAGFCDSCEADWQRLRQAGVLDLGKAADVR
jgi:hypothetical protein